MMRLRASWIWAAGVDDEHRATVRALISGWLIQTGFEDHRFILRGKAGEMIYIEDDDDLRSSARAMASFIEHAVGRLRLGPLRWQVTANAVPSVAGARAGLIYDET